MKKALLYLFIFICIQFFVTWVVMMAWIAIQDGSLSSLTGIISGAVKPTVTTACTVTSSLVCSAVALALFVWRKWAVLSRSYIRTRPFGVLLWAVVAAAGTILPSAWLQELMPGLPDVSGDALKAILGSRYGYFALCLFVPLVEEVVFRGAILHALLAWKPDRWVAILLSALIFAVAHFNPAQMPHAFLMGILLGWLYCRTGSILPGVAVHWVNNTITYAAFMLMPQTADMTLSQFFGGDQKRVALALIFSLFMLVPAIYQLNMRMKRA